MEKIKVAINGYGNLGRAVELAVTGSEDMELVAIFTRRDPADLETASGLAVAQSEMAKWVGNIDVCINCGGSATDLRHQSPEAATLFNVVDTFDTHAAIPQHFAVVDQVARENDRLALISTGWDPGLFSLNRLLGESILPQGETYTFWGPGLSQGHSDALRRIDGVASAVQYTIPNEDALESIHAGEQLELSTRDKHRRECWVVLEDGADGEAIREQIVTMPNYFAEYDTTVNFISQKEFDRDHTGMPHGGTVIRQGQTSDGTSQVMSFKLALDSNPEFTGSVACATARAVARMAAEGARGAITLFDVPPVKFSPEAPEALRKRLL
ncbi:diaminopimelate dehydrogenase [Ancrocorticia populi]|uniref:Meso-diaminopimelate D-dehydrogenase n=1 Tax=Ancrocorticia populi TaxID=2175228 RepID=A0A2V1K9L0_9ACTO|nr:diaminopimelate dehydrogenase [Ancrocorticia populi]PWF26990.1 diaminopimelate dehydrogenase [Ancrocorticia populi]